MIHAAERPKAAVLMEWQRHDSASLSCYVCMSVTITGAQIAHMLYEQTHGIRMVVIAYFHLEYMCTVRFSRKKTHDTRVCNGKNHTVE